MWDLSRPGIEPVFPELAGRLFREVHPSSFLITESHLPRNGSTGKESTCNAGDPGDVGSILELGRSPGVGEGNPLQYSCLENPRTEEPSGLQSKGLKASDTIERLSTHTPASKESPFYVNLV